MKPPAIILGDGLLRTPYGKTAHGLLRQSDRFAIVGVVEAGSGEGDAGCLIGSPPIGIPLTGSVESALLAARESPQWAIVGIALPGGRMSGGLRQLILCAVRHGLSVANGLHDQLCDDPEIVEAARLTQASLLDLRRVKPASQLSHWTGRVRDLAARRIAVLGTDCIVGKRTTASLLVAALTARGLRAELIYTGQTGWLQGANYGFVLDATINDFVSGEIEAALLKCAGDTEPDVMVIEGQSSMQNPATPCGAEIILSGDVHGVVLQHIPGRSFFSGLPGLKKAPSLETEIRILAAYGTPLLGICLNFAEAGAMDRDRYVAALEASHGVPVIAPPGGSLDPIAAPIAENALRARLCAR